MKICKRITCLGKYHCAQPRSVVEVETYFSTVREDLDLISSGREEGTKEGRGHAYNFTSSKGLLKWK